MRYIKFSILVSGQKPGILLASKKKIYSNTAF